MEEVHAKNVNIQVIIIQVCIEKGGLRDEQ